MPPALADRDEREGPALRLSGKACGLESRESRKTGEVRIEQNIEKNDGKTVGTLSSSDPTSAETHNKTTTRRTRTAMLKRRNIALLAVVVVAGLVVTAAWSTGTSAKDIKEDRYPLAGTWLGSVANSGFVVMMTATPLDPAANRVGLRLTSVTQDPNYGGMVKILTGHEATRATDWLGEAVRTGTNTYDFTFVRYLIDENCGYPTPTGDGGVNFRLVSTWMSSGTLTLTGPDTMDRTLSVDYYMYDPHAPDQPDPYDPEDPNPVRFTCGAGESTMTRLTVVPQCVPVPGVVGF
jgi:hypothetical protein